MLGGSNSGTRGGSCFDCAWLTRVRSTTTSSAQECRMGPRRRAASACILGTLALLSQGDVAVPVNFAPPAIPVPAEPACLVPLFNRTFEDTKAHGYEYPDGAKMCGDHWAKVILDLHCGVTPFNQYDRSLFVFLKGVNIFSGTTQEPNHSDAGAAWHVQADLSHYGLALLAGAGSGSVELDNLVNSVYTGVNYCSASLLFFNATEAYPAFQDPATHVVSLGTSYRHADGNDNAGNSSLLATIASLPQNTVRAELEMTLQNQQDEEFFWSSPNSAWRAALLRIDGKPAGVVPAYPIVFTGGNNPALWRPTPGVQTLRQLHRRLDLTPLISMLNDGGEHTIQLDLGLAGSTVTTFFYMTGTLLVWADASLAAVTGSVTTNTLEDCLATSCLAPVVQGGAATKTLRYTVSASQTLVPRESVAGGNGTLVAKVRTVRSDISIDFYGDGRHHNTTSTASTALDAPSLAEKSWTESFNMYFPSTRFVQQEFLSERHGYGAQGYASTVLWTDVATADNQTTSSTSFSFNDSAGNEWQRTLQALNGIRSHSTEKGSLQWWVDPFFGMRAPPTKIGIVPVLI